MAERELSETPRAEAHHRDGTAAASRVARGPAATQAPRILRGDELSQAIMRSLLLAAKDAHLIAYQTGTGVVTRRNGEPAVIAPDPAMYEDLIPPPFQESPDQ